MLGSSPYKDTVRYPYSVRESPPAMPNTHRYRYRYRSVKQEPGQWMCQMATLYSHPGSA